MSIVAPLVGAWIEISVSMSMSQPHESLLSWERGLKYRIPNFNSNKKFVAPLVGAWIEIHMEVDGTCLPIVAPLVGAWIEIL